MRKKKGLTFEHVFSQGSPYQETNWGPRNIELKADSSVVFKQDGITAPIPWSDRAVLIAASKYFRGHAGQQGREYSVRQLFDRVVDTITQKGIDLGYFDKVNAKIFNTEFKKLLIEQRLAFNSPVFFNVGIEAKPQGSACFVLSVDDNLESIAELQSAETKLFSMGSGSGTNLSPLRGAGEKLSRGGWASGPLSFLKAYDSWAGIIRSGGVLRRASKFMRLDDDHQDVFNGKEDGSDFISFKTSEEKKARALFDAGFTAGDAYSTVSGQNCNLSVGISNAFMKAAMDGGEWALKNKDGSTVKKVKAAEMLDSLAHNIWECGDPGVQFDDKINEWNSCPKYGKIVSSNPCSEFLPPGEGACNLLSINLAKFFGAPEPCFFEKEFLHAVHLAIVAQDILVDLSSYPLPRLDVAAKQLRPLGLGFANLGGLLMSLGIPYDSDNGRKLASALTALMTGQAFATSMELAKLLGSFPEFERNKKHVIAVLRKHKSALDNLQASDSISPMTETIIEDAHALWTNIMSKSQDMILRNSQVTLMAPTGTIGVMMDSDTGGVEPALMLSVNKHLTGGGTIKLTIGAVKPALEALGYTDIDKILKKITETGTAEGSGVLDKDLPVFDAAYPIQGRTRCLSAMAHLSMLAAIQPFISGGISKTIGQPNTVSAQEIKDIIVTAWKMGVKSVTIFREGSKIFEPLGGQKAVAKKPRQGREKLPYTVPSIRHKFEISGVEGYLHTGFSDEGRPLELFITIAKEGSTLRGLMDAFATAISIALQYHVPLSVFVEKFKNTKFEPWGVTSNPDVRVCSSIIDYVFRYLAKYDPDSREEVDAVTPGEEKKIAKTERKTSAIPTYNMCPVCGSILVRLGNCVYCPQGCPGVGSGTCGG